MEAVLQEDDFKKNNTRMASVELLRSVAMLMVITLHYLGKSGILVPLDEKQTVAGLCAWLLEAFCIVAVNTYVLVSGYFLVESGFKLRRIIILLAQLLFYSILVPAVLVWCGILPSYMLSTYNYINYIFPVQMNHYWFATAYIRMYIFVPVLSAGVKQLTKKQFQTLLILVLISFCVQKTFIPFELAMDDWGYSMVWFLCLFLFAAYIRLHGMPVIKKSYQGFLLYGVSCVLILAVALGVSYASDKAGKFEYLIDNTFDYNHLLCLLGALGLFLGFLYWKMPEGKCAAFARKIAPYTFGVYLLHENIEIRYLWPEWFGATDFPKGSWSVLNWIISIFVVFTAGIIVDYLRSLLFKGVEIVICKMKKAKKC